MRSAQDVVNLIAGLPPCFGHLPSCRGPFHELCRAVLCCAALQAGALIKYVQSMRGRRLWPSEDISLDSEQGLASTAALANMVQHCLDAFGFEPGLKQAWVSVSLDWALHARSRHLACRSQQVLRSLQPQLTGDMCAILLLCLQQCLVAAEGSSVARDVALELLLTLRELLEALPARKLLLYPQVCWGLQVVSGTSQLLLPNPAWVLQPADRACNMGQPKADFLQQPHMTSRWMRHRPSHVFPLPAAGLLGIPVPAVHQLRQHLHAGAAAADGLHPAAADA